MKQPEGPQEWEKKTLARAVAEGESIMADPVKAKMAREGAKLLQAEAAEEERAAKTKRATLAKLAKAKKSTKPAKPKPKRSTKKKAPPRPARKTGGSKKRSRR
jgi:hypothetical protein